MTLEKIMRNIEIMKESKMEPQTIKHRESEEKEEEEEGRTMSRMKQSENLSVVWEFSCCYPFGSSADPIKSPRQVLILLRI